MATPMLTGQQPREAFPFDQPPRYLLRDREAIFGQAFSKKITNMGTSTAIVDLERICPWIKIRRSRDRFRRRNWDESWRCHKWAGSTTATNDGPCGACHERDIKMPTRSLVTTLTR